MLDALASDPSTTQRRLGDGFYEQRLINEQIMQLTGQRYLEGYGDDDAQYRALMNAGITFAEQHDLRPGVALTAEQMAQLTSDIVWLVKQTMTLDDGSTVEVLVPQVYVRVREGDFTGDGTLIAGNSLQLDIAGDLLNSGTLAGREVVSLTADNIANLGGSIGGNLIDLEARDDLTNLEGRIDGGQINLTAGRDIANLGGEIAARESLSLEAGRDLTLASTTERVAGLYVSDAAGQLLASAGRDITVAGAEVSSAGSLQLAAGRDLDIASTLDHEQRWGGISDRVALDRSASVSAGGDLALLAGRDLTLLASEVSAGGSGVLSAGRDLTLDSLDTHDDFLLGRNTTRESQEIG
ncbi:hemagglutinin repeat-containing protein, partial [Vreelandella olivaria]|uniref:hemagglutinin repeat-containing protein n=1 Tax=Vreelandella olivaria TaxID=390919 RepID=UPI00201EC7F9